MVMEWMVQFNCIEIIRDVAVLSEVRGKETNK